MAETKLIVVRHGETQWNIEGRWQGHDDSPLTLKGRKQAKAVAQCLSKSDFSVIYSSDLGRAFHTAEIISETTGKKIIPDDRLRERHLGVFQGLTLSEMSEKQPEVFKEYQNSNPDHIIPEGESIRQIYTRSIACFNEIAQKHVGEAIVIVTHGGVLNGLVRYVNSISLEAQVMIKLWNAGINTFCYQKGKWELLTFGEINHLKNIGSLDDD
jgi:2,3-bisphosphoglycerate-dependent phosphoglycerate mutase